MAAGTRAIGVLTPEEDAKITLGLLSEDASMKTSLLSAGAIGVMRVGLGELLDFVLNAQVH